MAAGDGGRAGCLTGLSDLTGRSGCAGEWVRRRAGEWVRRRAGEWVRRRAGRVRAGFRGRDAMKPGFQRVQTPSIPGFTASGPARDPRPMVLMMPVLPRLVPEPAASPGQNRYPASITRRRAEVARPWRDLSKTPLTGRKARSLTGAGGREGLRRPHGPAGLMQGSRTRGEAIKPAACTAAAGV